MTQPWGSDPAGEILSLLRGRHCKSFLFMEELGGPLRFWTSETI